MRAPEILLLLIINFFSPVSGLWILFSAAKPAGKTPGFPGRLGLFVACASAAVLLYHHRLWRYLPSIGHYHCPCPFMQRGYFLSV